RPVRSGVADEVLAQLQGFERRAARRRAITAAVALVVLVGGAAGWTLRHAQNPENGAAVAQSLRVVRPERQMLADGSVVELKEGAQLSVEFEPALRRVVLRRGEAHFQVAKDAL